MKWPATVAAACAVLLMGFPIQAQDGREGDPQEKEARPQEQVLPLTLLNDATARYEVKVDRAAPAAKPDAPGGGKKKRGDKGTMKAPGRTSRARTWEYVIRVADGNSVLKTLAVTRTAEGEDEQSRTFTVRVDRNGNVTGIEAGAPVARGKEGDTGRGERPVSARGEEAGAARILTRDTKAEIEMHLCCILGTGLHGKPLEADATYELSLNGASAAGGMGKSRLPAKLRLRFDGIRDGTGNRLAHFTIGSPKKEMGEGEDEPAGARISGQAAWRLDDGCLNSLNVRFTPGKRTGMAGEKAPGGLKTLRITRQ